VINKADGESENLARLSRQQYAGAMSLLRHSSFWTPRVMTCSALKLDNIDTVWELILEYYTAAKSNHRFTQKRAEQNLEWMHQLVKQMLLLKLDQNPEVASLLPRLEADVQSQRVTPYSAARQIIDKL